MTDSNSTIIKEFSDPIFYQRNFLSESKNNYGIHGKWFWALTSNGHLYCRCTAWINDDSYRQYNHTHPTALLSDMMRIVKEFGHLVVLL